MRQQLPKDAGYGSDGLHVPGVGVVYPGGEFEAEHLVPGCTALDTYGAPAEPAQDEDAPAAPSAPETAVGDGEPAAGEGASGVPGGAEDQAPEEARPASRARNRSKETEQ